jgi:hypothetical protein
MADGNNQKKIADCTLAANAGLVALVFSTRFFPISESLCWGIIFAVSGVVAILWAYASWRKI